MTSDSEYSSDLSTKFSQRKRKNNISKFNISSDNEDNINRIEIRSKKNIFSDSDISDRNDEVSADISDKDNNSQKIIDIRLDYGVDFKTRNKNGEKTKVFVDNYNNNSANIRNNIITDNSKQNRNGETDFNSGVFDVKINKKDDENLDEEENSISLYESEHKGAELSVRDSEYEYEYEYEDIIKPDKTAEGVEEEEDDAPIEVDSVIKKEEEVGKDEEKLDENTRNVEYRKSFGTKENLNQSKVEISDCTVEFNNNRVQTDKNIKKNYDTNVNKQFDRRVDKHVNKEISNHSKDHKFHKKNVEGKNIKDMTQNSRNDEKYKGNVKFYKNESKFRGKISPIKDDIEKKAVTKLSFEDRLKMIRDANKPPEGKKVLRRLA